VHQFKLLEGIDDPRFKLLAIADELKTVRTLVQQVGRIVRNPERNSNSVAYVLDQSEERQKELWQNYLQYDASIDSGGIDVLSRSHEAIIKILADKGQPLIYVDGRFRTPAELDALDPWDELKLPLTVNVHKKTEDSDLQKVQSSLLSDYRSDDRTVRAIAVDDAVTMVLYVSFRNSSLLRTMAFVEPRLGVTIVRDPDQFVFYFDSEGGRPSPRMAGIGRPVAARTLQKLFQRSLRWKLGSVALSNTNLGASMIRSRAISAVEIEATVPAFDDHAFVCSTAYGFTEEVLGDGRISRQRRYVGFGSGKVSDLSNRRVSLAEYLGWLSGIQAVLDGSSEPISTFRRWASISQPPRNPAARNILIDPAELRLQYVTIASDGVPGEQDPDIDELCRDVSDGAFTLLANGQECEVRIHYDDERESYILVSPTLDGMFASIDDSDRRTVVDYLNETQAFHVIPTSSGAFYTQGQFYAPLIKFGPNFDEGKAQVLSLLTPIDSLNQADLEKGTQCKAGGGGWQNGCVFDLIDSRGVGTTLANHLEDLEILVCDDMNDEAADFILLQRGSATRRRRLAFLHAKARSEPSFYSASDLQDVCGQAVKNLGELSQFGEARTSRVEKWGLRWRSGQVQGQVARIREGGSPSGVWEIVREAIRDPNTDREVWLLLGQILSASRLTRELRRAQPRPSAVQTAYLLLSTATTIASGGARLRVFCSS